MSAAHHILLAIDTITPPEIFPGDARIRGRVIHVWEGSIPLGTTIEVTRRTARRDDAAAASAESHWETIRNAKYLDAFLEGSGNYYAIAGEGAMFLSVLPPNIKPPKDAVDSPAKAALTTSLIGCGCAPFALLGAFLALKSISQAHRSGRRVPPRAVVALVLSMVILVLAILFLNEARKYGKQQEAATQIVANRLQGKREAASLDIATACDLVREYFLEGHSTVPNSSTVTCHGPLQQTATTAMLRGVDTESTVERGHLTACFVRTSRWFVAGVLETDIACPAIRLPSPADEKSVRAVAADEFNRAEDDAFAQKISAIREKLKSETVHEQKCQELVIDPYVSVRDEKRLKPAAFELTGESDWSFMTASDIHDALDLNSSPHERAFHVRHIRRDSGPYLVVYLPERRTVPEIRIKKGVLQDDFSYIGGAFQGWMIVVDTRSDKPVCEGRLSFASSRQIDYSHRGSGSSDESRYRSTVQSDFESQFKDRASELIHEMSDGKLRLGYKFAE